MLVSDTISSGKCEYGEDGIALYSEDTASQLDSNAVPSGVVCYTGTNPGSIAIYHCNTGFQFQQMQTVHVRLCRSNGLWSGVIPSCTLVSNNGKLLLSHTYL